MNFFCRNQKWHLFLFRVPVIEDDPSADSVNLNTEPKAGRVRFNGPGGGVISARDSSLKYQFQREQMQRCRTSFYCIRDLFTLWVNLHYNYIQIL
jgi:hypothetical protein